MTMIRLIKSEFLKMKNTPYYYVHVIVPIIGALIMLYYCSGSSMDSYGKVEGFFILLAVAFPCLIGIVSSNVVNTEGQCGNYKEILSTKHSRNKMILSKILMLLISEIISVFIAAALFYIGFNYVLKQNTLNINIYIILSLVLMLSQIFLYLLHVFLTFQFGSGASIIVGIFESVVSALMLTGLGENLWKYLPCGWGVRIVPYFLYKYRGYENLSKIAPDINSGIINCSLFTAVFLIIIVVWFNLYEPKIEK